MAAKLELLEVETEKSGTLKVYVQGNLAERQGKTIFLSLHDMGCNYRSLVAFVSSESMREVAAHSVFLHVCAPGQDDGAEDLPGDFPSLDELALDLGKVLDKVGLSSCIALGEGAGANVLARWALAEPNKVLGLVLVHCTSTTAGVLETIKDKVMNWQMAGGVLSQAAHDYLVFHKFGDNADKGAVKAYTDDLQQTLNVANLSKFLAAFQARSDLSQRLATGLASTETLLVVGAKASHLHTVHTMHQALPKGKATLLVVDEVGDVLSEAPEKLTRALILFAKGTGALSGVGIPGMEKQRSLSNSMEAADRPL